MAGKIIALTKKEVDIFRVFVRNRTLLCYDFSLAFAVEFDVTNLVLLIFHFTIHSFCTYIERILQQEIKYIL